MMWLLYANVVVMVVVGFMLMCAIQLTRLAPNVEVK